METIPPLKTSGGWNDSSPSSILSPGSAQWEAMSGPAARPGSDWDGASALSAQDTAQQATLAGEPFFILKNLRKFFFLSFSLPPSFHLDFFY